MFAFDDRTGNILTTIAAFAAIVAVAFVAHATLVAFVLGLLLAYLLEPIVSAFEHVLPTRSYTRGASIAIVYGMVTLVALVTAYTMAPTLVDQFRRLDRLLPDLPARIDTMRAGGQGNLLVGIADRVSQAAVSAAEDGAWLLISPIVAIFFLRNRAAFLDGAVDVFARRADRAGVKRTVQQVDRALAEYTRGQLILAALSAAFYMIVMALFRVPYAFALGIAGGALEFVPVVGWLVAAAAMLVSAWLAHSHWIWMAALIVAWRIVQNFVNSPRVMGDRMQMEPLTVLFALMVGSEIGGLAGAILSIPAVAVLRIVWAARAARDTSPVSLVKS